MTTGYIPPGTAMQSLRAVCDAFDLPLEVRTALEIHLRLTVDAILERCAAIAEEDYRQGRDDTASRIRALNTRLSV